MPTMFVCHSERSEESRPGLFFKALRDSWSPTDPRVGSFSVASSEQQVGESNGAGLKVGATGIGEQSENVYENKGST